MLDFYVGEERRVAKVGLAAGTNVVAVVGLVAASAPTSTLLKGVLQTGGKHFNIQLYKSCRLSYAASYSSSHLFGVDRHCHAIIAIGDTQMPRLEKEGNGERGRGSGLRLRVSVRVKIRCHKHGLTRSSFAIIHQLLTLSIIHLNQKAII